MKFMHGKVIDTSVLYARKNGSKMKLKTLAFNILKVSNLFYSETNPSRFSLFIIRLQSNFRPDASKNRAKPTKFRNKDFSYVKLITRE